MSTSSVNIASLTAPLLFGVLFAVFLFGVLTVQVYLYHTTFEEDKPWLKSLVYSVYTIDLCATLMAVSDAYRWFGSGFGDRQSLDHVYLSPIHKAILGSTIAFIVQIFYCYRIVKLERKAWPVTVLITLLALLSSCTAIFTGSRSYIAGYFSAARTMPPFHKTIVLVSFASAAIVDVIITITLIILLLRGRKSLTIQSRFLVKRILNLTVETNLLSSSIAILTLVLIVAVPQAPWFACPAVVLGRVYSNSLLLLLNNRRQARQALGMSVGLSGTLAEGNPTMLSRGDPRASRFTVASDTNKTARMQWQNRMTTPLADSDSGHSTGGALTFKI